MRGLKFQRWSERCRNSVRVMFLMWGSKERVRSSEMLRLLTCVDRETGYPSMCMTGLLGAFDKVVFEPMTMTSVLLPLSFRKLEALISWRKLMREVGGRGAMGLDEIYSWVKLGCDHTL